MKVLSLFDGISCGQIALNKAGIKYDEYYASEWDEVPISVTQDNYPLTKQMGDVRKLNSDDLPPIDLLIGGSPCTDFSFSGKRKGMVTIESGIEVTKLDTYLKLKKGGFEFEGQSYLFWEYVRLLKETKPKYFFLENVKMAPKWEDIISETLGVKPVKINSSDFSAQNRPRLYWTNITYNKEWDKNEDVISDIMSPEEDIDDKLWIAQEKVINCIDTKNYLQYDTSGKGYKSQSFRAYYPKSKMGCLNTWSSSLAKIQTEDGRVRKITRNEAELLQTIPKDYTKVLNRNKAIDTIGNGWTVDVIAHFFKNLK